MIRKIPQSQTAYKPVAPPQISHKTPGNSFGISQPYPILENYSSSTEYDMYAICKPGR